METKENVFTSSKELIKSKFSRTWKMETKEKVLTSSNHSIYDPTLIKTQFQRKKVFMKDGRGTLFSNINYV